MKGCDCLAQIFLSIDWQIHPSLNVAMVWVEHPVKTPIKSRARVNSIVISFEQYTSVRSYTLDM
jgi:hypothetical protein